jgi:preprotein translocase subunit SecD
MKVHLGLDLQGGTQLTLDVDMTNIPAKDRDNTLTGVYNVIERRVNAFGVSEPIIQKSVTGTGEYRILVELPGIQNMDEAKKLVGKTAQLEFKEYIMESQAPLDLGSGTPVAQQPKVTMLDTGITGKDFKRAEPRIDQNNQYESPYYVSFELNDSIKQKFGDLTTRLNLAKETSRLAILLDGEILINATVQSPITNGQGTITGMENAEKSKELAIQLNAGALPAPISIVDERHISATLGQDALKKSAFAGIIGIFTVMLFMVLFYRIPGLLSIAALSVYIVLTLALFKLIPVVLTLAGIAGFVLSVGVAVDANILIFERLREELATGKTVGKAVELGFERAWSSIRDSNAATLITCLILYIFGTGVIRGFAITLALGVFVSLFTAIAVTREFLHRVLEMNIFKNRTLL